LVAGLNQGLFISARGFNNDAFDRVVFKDTDKAANMRFGIWDGVELPGGMKSNVQIGFTDIDADNSALLYGLEAPMTVRVIA